MRQFFFHVCFCLNLYLPPIHSFSSHLLRVKELEGKNFILFTGHGPQYLHDKAMTFWTLWWMCDFLQTMEKVNLGNKPFTHLNIFQLWDSSSCVWCLPYQPCSPFPWLWSIGLLVHTSLPETFFSHYHLFGCILL